MYIMYIETAGNAGMSEDEHGRPNTHTTLTTSNAGIVSNEEKEEIGSDAESQTSAMSYIPGTQPDPLGSRKDNSVIQKRKRKEAESAGADPGGTYNIYIIYVSCVLYV